MKNIQEKVINLLSGAVKNSGFDIVQKIKNQVIGIHIDFEEIGCSRSYIKLIRDENENKINHFHSELYHSNIECDFICSNCEYDKNFNIHNINWT
jgi:hypothetical protein